MRRGRRASSAADRGCALMLVTHDRAIAERCNRVIEMDAGRLVH